MAAATQVAGGPQQVDGLARALRRFSVAARSELVVQSTQSITVPALGAGVAQASGGLDGAVEEHQALRPGAAEGEHVAHCVGQLKEHDVKARP